MIHRERRRKRPMATAEAKLARGGPPALKRHQRIGRKLSPSGFPSKLRLQTREAEMTTLEKDLSLQDTIAALGPWFHNLHLPGGVQTAPAHPLGDFPANKWAQIAPHIPQDLCGWSVLDIGCNAGFYSFELARRGARVTAIDYDERYLEQARWAADVMGLRDRIEFRRQQVYDLAREQTQYDLVWFMGVFYHLRYPLLGLDIVSRITSRRLVFQTLTLPGEEVSDVVADIPLEDRSRMTAPGWPKMAFIERRLADDPTNWWAANHAGVEALLRSAGFAVIARPAHEIYLCEPSPPADEGISHLLEAEFLAATGQEGPI
jgi:tRNA (mo5U34)-methyltransferase